MSVEGDEELEKRILLFADDFEAKVNGFFRYAGNFLLFDFELFVYLFNICVQLRVRLNLLLLMIDLL